MTSGAFRIEFTASFDIVATEMKKLTGVIFAASTCRVVVGADLRRTRCPK